MIIWRDTTDSGRDAVDYIESFTGVWNFSIDDTGYNISIVTKSLDDIQYDVVRIASDQTSQSIVMLTESSQHSRHFLSTVYTICRSRRSTSDMVIIITEPMTFPLLETIFTLSRVIAAKFRRHMFLRLIGPMTLPAEESNAWWGTYLLAPYREPTRSQIDAIAAELFNNGEVNV